jgi:hypothetical protein
LVKKSRQTINKPWPAELRIIAAVDFGEKRPQSWRRDAGRAPVPSGLQAGDSFPLRRGRPESAQAGPIFAGSASGRTALVNKVCTRRAKSWLLCNNGVPSHAGKAKAPSFPVAPPTSIGNVMFEEGAR